MCKPPRVLGQGGFGQVLEVVKRDCGKRYGIQDFSTYTYFLHHGYTT